MTGIHNLRAANLLVFFLAACGGREPLTAPEPGGYEGVSITEDEAAAQDALKKIQNEIAAARAALEELERKNLQNANDKALQEAIEQARKRMEEATAKEKALQEELERKKQEMIPFELQFKFSQKCLEIDGGRPDDNARTIQLACNKSNQQKFRFLQKATGYLIQNVVTGKCLATFQGGTGNGTPVTQANCAELVTQLFEKIADGAGSYFLKNIGSARCLQIETNQPTDRLGVELFDCLQNETQKIAITQDTP